MSRRVNQCMHCEVYVALFGELTSSIACAPGSLAALVFTLV